MENGGGRVDLSSSPGSYSKTAEYTTSEGHLVSKVYFLCPQFQRS